MTPEPPGASGPSGRLLPPGPAEVARISIGGPETLDLEAIAPVHAAAFAEPPYSEPDATDLLRGAPRHAQRDGFVLAIARDGESVVGFAYGVTAHPRLDWVAELVDVPGTVSELVELAVHPCAHGRGIGAGLLEAVLEDRPEPVTVLQTHDGDGPAMRLSLRMGFRRIGRTTVGVAMAKQLR
ncbi:MAG: GNAT family N-acetyltransferase [Acidobacteria bacterium]|nr:GNAT family N-acetyltransferase [Acidobacteriota bacterium]